jgi:uncharacterized membrane protein YeiH
MLFYLWDCVAVFVFAVSGAIAGRRKEMDWWGMFVVGVVTGTGGGTLRSLLIGDLPPPILRDPSYLALATIATAVAIAGEAWWNRAQRIVSIIDALGLGVYVCLGIMVSLEHGLAPWAALAMGVVTAVFGGVLRDVIRAEVPLIFRREIYATVALAGGILFLATEAAGLARAWSIPVIALLTLAGRLLAIRYQINMPTPGRRG